MDLLPAKGVRGLYHFQRSWVLRSVEPSGHCGTALEVPKDASIFADIYKNTYGRAGSTSTEDALKFEHIYPKPQT